MRILVINSGSSSIKFRLAEVVEENGTLAVRTPLVEGAVKGIGGVASFEMRGSRADRPMSMTNMGDHTQAMRALFDRLGDSLSGIDAVGHRVVHGGSQYLEPTVITDEVEAGIDALSELAPLHNPGCLAGIRGAKAVLQSPVPMVAVFDTAFHQTMPEVARRYAIPTDMADRHRIRRYGFHGIAHASLANGYAAFTGKSLKLCSLITVQLGNGCSVAAIANGKSVDTSMGFTPLEGLVMGTRSGDVDPAILEFVSIKEGMTFDQVDTLLNKQSGLLGVSGLTADMRELLQEEREHGDRRARLAIDLFYYRVRKYIGAYLASMNGADAIVFSGGIGENSPEIRERICAGMDWLGITLDASRNAALSGAEGRVDREGGRVQLWVIPTDEELLIARDTWRVVTGADVRY